MKRLKGMWLSVLPTALLLVVTIVVFMVVRAELLEREAEECWERLNEEVVSTTEEISVRLHDNLQMLELMTDAIVIHGEELDTESLKGYITSTRENTIFQKITIAFPNGNILDEDGTFRTHRGKDPSYEELAASGTCVTTQAIDDKLKREVVYCSAPIIGDNGKVFALLIGTIDCINLQDYFRSSIYDDNGSVFIIDRRDGNFVMDSLHDGVLPTLESMESEWVGTSFKEKSFVQMIKDGESGTNINVSPTTGEITYFSFAPIPDTDWTTLVTIPEDYILTSVSYIDSILRTMAVTGTILMILVMLFHVIVAVQAAKERIRLQEYEREKVSHQTKNRFLSTMSHDIRTPLNGIIGMVDIIEKFEDDEERVKDCVKKIKISANYLLALTTDMLDLNAIEEGKVQFNEEAVDLREFVESLKTLIEQKAAEYGVTCNFDYTNITHPNVFASVVHIRRIMVNIISNAIKYNRKNGSIWVTIDELSNDGIYGQYRLTVRDSGIGMTEEFQKTMFDSFEQEAISARSKDQGHGLGLSIVKRLTELMNGTIKVESQKDVGTTFYITLPFRINTTEYIANKEPVTERADLMGIHVLVVEDNEFNMEIACVLLGHAGAEITTAANGRIALETFESSAPGTFDIILMDVMMPEMDGLSATKAIRSLDRADAKTVPIVAMTANAFSADAKACIDAGMNEHVAKPLDMDVITQKIIKYLR